MDEGIRSADEGREIGRVQTLRPRMVLRLESGNSKARIAGWEASGTAGSWSNSMSRMKSGFGANSVGIRIESTGLILDGLVDFTTMDGDMLGRLDTETNLVSANLDHGHRDVVVDDDALVLFAGENQHKISSLVLIAFGADRFVL